MVGCGYFTERLQRVHSVYVTCSQNKSMVFGVQKGGFCIAKVWFLIFECYVVANRSHAFRG